MNIEKMSSWFWISWLYLTKQTLNDVKFRYTEIWSRDGESKYIKLAAEFNSWVHSFWLIPNFVSTNKSISQYISIFYVHDIFSVLNPLTWTSESLCKTFCVNHFYCLRHHNFSQSMSHQWKAIFIGSEDQLRKNI